MAGEGLALDLNASDVSCPHERGGLGAMLGSPGSVIHRQSKLETLVHRHGTEISHSLASESGLSCLYRHRHLEFV